MKEGLMVGGLVDVKVLEDYASTEKNKLLYVLSSRALWRSFLFAEIIILKGQHETICLLFYALKGSHAGT